MRRREFLLGCSSLFIVSNSSAIAAIPAIITAIGAITALAIATGKAANALEEAVKTGEDIWSRISSISERAKADKKIKSENEKLQDYIDRRFKVQQRLEGYQVRSSYIVDDLQDIIQSPTRSKWQLLIIKMRETVSRIQETSRMVRENAVWFPPDAQAALSSIITLQYKRVKVLNVLSKLPDKVPNRDEIEKLTAAFDNLRVESLRLVTALRSYARQT